jgi:hypothetical protein
MSDYKIQSVLFDNSKFTLENAANFLARNNFKYSKVDKTKNLLRFRQLNPAAIRKEGYNHYITKPISEGISLVIAYP